MGVRTGKRELWQQKNNATGVKIIFLRKAGTLGKSRLGPEGVIVVDGGGSGSESAK